MKKLIAVAIGAAALALGSAARADVIVYAGYYDLTPCCGNTNPLPDPWVGSANTTFFGDTAYATSSDPDESAVRIQNTGPNAVTLNAGFSIGGFALWDSFIGSGYVIGAGQNVIFGATDGDNFDGSDDGINHGSTSLHLNGVQHSFGDPTNVLAGAPFYDETIPWTEIGRVGVDGTPGIPEPATWALMLGGFGLAGASLRKRRAARA